ncbi:thioredoxin domain-containing protein [Gulosibacter chungangensis]|uniref:Thioredoxin domain-containing protein n=1 Tax=Gulosibacter chungangensis TaxID=979746 RepID=A0A7J5B9H1_9MICO|nr:thioredoxin domain-containing protein [Gulosibacter chungangensis]KAB1642183.1 thioredoxin domain-containing protein [Gulosibacter chungangensis]
MLGALLASRRQRPQPARDEQVVAEWNGLIIDAFVTAALHFDEPNLVNVAERTANYIWQSHRVAGRLRHSSRDGVVGEALGTAGDLGALAIGMLRLAAVRGDEVWLERAISLLEEADAHFAAPGGGWFDAAADAEALIYRPRDGSDSFSPSPTSLLITANQLASRLGHRERRGIAHRAERSRIQRLLAGPELAGWALHDAILRASARPPAETVVTAPTKAEAWPLAVAAARQAEPAELILIGDATVDSAAFGGLFEARTAVAEPTAYVCRAGICELPRASFRAEGGVTP